jgi:hypothetical protein
MMILSDEQIEEGFWGHLQINSMVPKSVSYPDEYQGATHINIVCTQLSISDYQQKKLVNQWCNRIPEMDQIRYLWFNSRVNQALFDAACKNHHLEGLFVKRSGIKDLSYLTNLNNLKYLHIGSSPSVGSIDVFSMMSQLIVLQIENFKRIQDISPLQSLSQLEGLAIEGSMWNTQIVESLEPLSDLLNLRYIFLANLRSLDQTLEPLSRLRKLRNIRTTFKWPKSEFKLLRNSLPELAYGTPFQTELIDQFSK